MCSCVRCAAHDAGEEEGLPLGRGVQPRIGLVEYWSSVRSLDPPILFAAPPTCFEVDGFEQQPRRSGGRLSWPVLNACRSSFGAGLTMVRGEERIFVLPYYGVAAEIHVGAACRSSKNV